MRIIKQGQNIERFGLQIVCLLFFLPLMFVNHTECARFCADKDTLVKNA